MRISAWPMAAALLLITPTASAETLAACGPQSGHAYYPAAGLVPKGKDGWSGDQVSGGATTLTRNAEGRLDLLFKDSRGEIFSARDDDGEVVLLRRSENEIAVLVVYPTGAQAAEIYAFVREADGKAKMLQLSSKGLSAAVSVPKAGVYIADCTTFNSP